MSNPNYKMLLVDDEPNILRAVTRILRTSSVELITASSAEDALTKLEHEKVALVLTDYRMPGMNGVELLRRVRNIDPDTIRMIISGHSDMETVLSAINEGEVFRFITKPWNDLDLQVSINLALAHRRLVDEKRALAEELEYLRTLLARIRQADPALVESVLTEPMKSELKLSGKEA